MAEEHAQLFRTLLGGGLASGRHQLINYERADVPLRSTVLSDGCSRRFEGGKIWLYLYILALGEFYGEVSKAQRSLRGGWEESCVQGEEAKFLSMRRNNVKTE